MDVPAQAELWSVVAAVLSWPEEAPGAGLGAADHDWGLVRSSLLDRKDSLIFSLSLSGLGISCSGSYKPEPDKKAVQVE